MCWERRMGLRTRVIPLGVTPLQNTHTHTHTHTHTLIAGLLTYTHTHTHWIIDAGAPHFSAFLISLYPVCVRGERVCVFVRESVCVCVCVSEERECVCVCERERERQ